jgi:hypothetical protein
MRTDRIKRPEDLMDRRIGVPEYQLTAIVWARSILQDDFGVAAGGSDLGTRWYRHARTPGKAAGAATTRCAAS